MHLKCGALKLILHDNLPCNTWTFIAEDAAFEGLHV